jgi:hypothetical protein
MWNRLRSIEYGFSAVASIGMPCSLAYSMQLLAPLELPLAPRGDDLDARAEVIRGELEPHLIVALAGGAVADRVAALGLRRLHHAAADAGPRERGAHQVLLLVERAGTQRREHVVADELEAKIADDGLGRADGERLDARTFEILLLTDVGTEADDLAVVLLRDPTNSDGGIEPSRVCEQDLADHAGVICEVGTVSAGCRAGTADTGSGTPRSAACPRRRAARPWRAGRRSVTARRRRAD